jgi:heme exporter protein D
MSWQSLEHFLSMGGYGLYVWGSYAVMFGLIAAEIALVAKRRRDVVRELRAWAAQRDTRRT